MIVEQFRQKHNLPEWRADKKIKALVSSGAVDKMKMRLILPETFMNDSGKCVGAIGPTVLGRKIAKGGRFYENLIVVHDDIDLGLGAIRLVWNRGPGGHNGLKSVIKALGSEAFARLRVGTARATTAGKVKKPAGEEAVIAFILGKFTPKELVEFKKVSKRAVEALALILEKGKDAAMNIVNRS